MPSTKRPSKSIVDPVEFVRDHGVVLASAKGRVPNLADAIAGETIRGSWWGHPKGHEIFRALGAVDRSDEILCFRLVQGKLTYVHRRLWPALVRLSDELGADNLTAIRQVHTDSGAHENIATPFPAWVPTDVKAAARELSIDGARSALGNWAARLGRGRPLSPTR